MARRKLTPKSSGDQLLATLFPTVAKWVRCGGWIEIGDQDNFGFTVRALDYGGMAFEDIEARTLDEAMLALERNTSLSMAWT
jgi:hypothetical protein